MTLSHAMLSEEERAAYARRLAALADAAKHEMAADRHLAIAASEPRVARSVAAVATSLYYRALEAWEILTGAVRLKLRAEREWAEFFERLRARYGCRKIDWAAFPAVPEDQWVRALAEADVFPPAEGDTAATKS